MRSENIGFWTLLMMCALASVIPMYPPIPLAWLSTALIWHHRYGPSWYSHDLKTDEDHFFIFDLLICLPLVVAIMSAMIIENIWRKYR